MLKFSDSNGFTKACGMVSRLSSAREILELLCSPRSRIQNRHRQATANFECFTSLFAQTGKIFSQHSANLKSGELISNSRITKSLTRFISVIPTATSWRSQHMNSKAERRKYAFIDALQSDSHWAATGFRK